MDFPENTEAALDTKILSDFVFELNISRRCVTSYPKGHPLISASVKKAVNLLPHLLEFRQEITLGIARDTLIFGKSFLDKKNPVYQDYARILFHHGIAALTVERNLDAEELLHFNETLSQTREKIREGGGIERVVESAGIRHLRVEAIEYGLFRATEDDQIEVPVNGGQDKKNPSIWGDFVSALLDGTLDPTGKHLPGTSEIDPAILAQIISERGSNDFASRESSYEREIASYVRRVLGNEDDSLKRKAYLDKLGRFVNNLNPEFRRKFLAETLKFDAPPQEFAEEILPQFSEEVILDTLENMNLQNSPPSPLILNLLQKLSRNFQGGDASKTVLAEVKDSGPTLAEKLGVIFRDDDIELLVPQSYQNTLRNIIASEQISGLDPEGMESLNKSLDCHCVDIQMDAIILEILKSGLAGDNTEGLERNLMDLVNYFLGVGDFEALNQLHNQLIGCDPSAPGISYSPIGKALAAFETPEFMDGVLKGLPSWGKEKYPHIEKLIQKVGKAFVEPILDHLAEEPSLSIRRFYIELLLKMGGVVRDAALIRLRDKRWYFVRNLALILRNLGDPSVLPAIKRLRGSRHPRVREEVFRTLLYFQDPDAEQILLEDLSSQEREIQRGAVQLAEDSRHPEVLNKLLEVLNRGGIFGADFDLKIEVIWTLARIGNPQSFPHLERLLQSRTFLHRQAINRLKTEAIASLEFYPAQEATLFLEKFSKNRELGNVVSQTLKKIQMRAGS